MMVRSAVVTNFVAVVIVLAATYSSPMARMDESAPRLEYVKSTSDVRSGRLYVFREVRSFGAHLNDYVTINGMRVAKVTPKKGFYCDVAPGDYVLGMVGHKTNALRVSIEAGQQQYVVVKLDRPDGVAVRAGAITSDQRFVLRLMEPAYGAERVQEYHMSAVNCAP